MVRIHCLFSSYSNKPDKCKHPRFFVFHYRGQEFTVSPYGNKINKCEHSRLLILSTWRYEFSFLLGKNFMSRKSFSSQKLYPWFSSSQCTPEVLYPLGHQVGPLHQLPLGFRFKMLDPCFIPHDNLWQVALTSSIILMQKTCGYCFLSLTRLTFVTPHKHTSWNCQTFSSVNFNYTPLHQEYINSVWVKLCYIT